MHIGGAINVVSMEQTLPDGSCSTQYYVNGLMNGPEAPQTPEDQLRSRDVFDFNHLRNQVDASDGLQI